MLTEKQIEDVIEELEDLIVIAEAHCSASIGPILSSAARRALKILKTEEPQSRDCW